MEINIPNQVWIYNEINRLLTPHCRHAWYLAVKNFFFCQACLIYGRPIQTTAFRFGIYFWQIRCRVVGSGTRWRTIHKRRTFVSLRKRVGNSRQGWAYCTGTWTDWSQRVVVFSFSLSGWFSFQKSDINYGIPRRPFSQRSIRQLYTARGIDGSRSIPWNVNYVTRNVPRDDRGEKVTIDCFLFETTT